MRIFEETKKTFKQALSNENSLKGLQMFGVFIVAMAIPPVFVYTTLIPGLPFNQESYASTRAALSETTVLAEYNGDNVQVYSQELNDADGIWTAAPDVIAEPDSACYVEGSSSTNFKIGEDFSTGLIAYRNITGNNNLNLSDCDSVSLWIKSSVSLEDDVIQLKLSENYDGAGPAELLSIPGSALDGKGWHKAQICLSDKHINYGSIRSVALFAPNDPGAVAIWLDVIETPSIISAGEPAKFQMNELVCSPPEEVMLAG